MNIVSRSITSKREVKKFMNKVASSAGYSIRKNNLYHLDLLKFYRYQIPKDSSILEVGCGTGDLICALKPKRGIGIDISPGMIKLAKRKHQKNINTKRNVKFLNIDVEKIRIKKHFDYIIISDTVGYFSDVQKAFLGLQRISHSGTRILINYHSYLWLPLLILAEKLKRKIPSMRLNWLNFGDLNNLLYLSNFEIIKTGRRFIFPFHIPVLSNLINRYLSQLPLLNSLCITNYLIAKPIISDLINDKLYSVSVIIPARNERGNIENAIKRIPKMGKSTEIIFIEGHSTDDTLSEIERVAKKFSKQFVIKFAVQRGTGKGDAVRLGFDMAHGDILMILDADLTVSPEDLPKFYDAIATGKGEFINGSRLVYPMENEAMRTLNIFGNNFFSIMFTWLLGQRLKDTLCGTKVISRLNYRKLRKNRNYFGNFDPFGDFDLLFGAAKLNLKIIELPIRYKAREYGTTNISRFKHGWLLLKMVVFAMNKIKFI